MLWWGWGNWTAWRRFFFFVLGCLITYGSPWTFALGIWWGHFQKEGARSGMCYCHQIHSLLHWHTQFLPRNDLFLPLKCPWLSPTSNFLVPVKPPRAAAFLPLTVYRSGLAVHNSLNFCAAIKACAVHEHQFQKHRAQLDQRLSLRLWN